LEAGTVLAGKYRIIRKLGSGSEGSVYLALHIHTGLFWAVKVIRTEAGDGSDSFCHELDMMKHMDNPHLPRIIDLFREADRVCLVMEYVRGKSLNSFLKSGAVLEEGQVLDVAQQLAEALCYLESRPNPVCHLDIKPSNLIRRADGMIILVDFGSAWKGSAKLRGLGTDGYAAPEQYRSGGPESGESAQVDGRADIYALGATVYRMLSGKLYSRTLAGSRIPGCREDLEKIVKRCLREAPEDRFQTALSLNRALTGLCRKRRREKARLQSLGAAALALPALAFCVYALPSSIDLTQEESWNYEKLLEQALCAGEEESRDYYSRAVFLRPGESGCYLQFLESAGADGHFSGQEEAFLRQLLHTVELGQDQTNEEVLERDPAEFGKTAFRIALSYWYGYEGEGKRIAAGWFGRAAEAGRRGNIREDWVFEADLYHRMWTITQTLLGENGKDRTGEMAASYWERQGELLAHADSLDCMDRMNLYLEAVSQIPFLTEDLSRAGILSSAVTERLKEIRALAEAVQGSAGQQKILAEKRDKILEAVLTAQEAADNMARTEWEEDRETVLTAQEAADNMARTEWEEDTGGVPGKRCTDTERQSLGY
jgi:serine/threonine-protein kinase